MQCHVAIDDAERVTCQCRKYLVSQEFIGPLTEFTDAPLSSCNKLTGYRPVAYTKLHNLMEYVRSQLPKPSPKSTPEIHFTR